MNKWLAASSLALFLTTGAGASAQAQSGGSALLNAEPITLGTSSAPPGLPLSDLSDTSASASPSVSGTGANAKGASSPAPTEITCTQEATFDEKTHKAVFLANVRVKDPQFTLTCDKLTAYLKNDASKAPGAAGSASPGAGPAPGKAAASPVRKPAQQQARASASPGSSPSASPAPGGGGLDSADAEGHVVIVQEKPDPKTGKPTISVGKAGKAHYDGTTGDVTLTIWPQVQQGLNTHISTERSTIMIMNQAGRMHTIGPSTTLIADKAQLAPSPSPSPSPAP